MQLINSLYTITSETSNDKGHTYTIALNPEHFIYKAHFPGEPITPGVCIMQIAHELLERLCEAKLNVTCIKNVKFLRVLTPEKDLTVDYTFPKVTTEDDNVKSQVTVSVGNEAYAKLSVVCRK